MNYAAGQAGNPSTQLQAIQRLADRVSSLNEEAAKLRERLSSFADRVGGTEPQDRPTLAGPSPVPNGSMNGLLHSIEDVQKIVGECHALMVRIERIG
jgi:hypothetical protein